MPALLRQAVLLSPAHRPGDYRRGSAATHRAGAPIVIAFLLFAILAVIFWPLALIIGLGWVALLILRICFGITVLGVKVGRLSIPDTLISLRPI